jgi:hypothetical protein
MEEKMKKMLILVLTLTVVGLFFWGCVSSSPPHPCPNGGCGASYSISKEEEQWDVCSNYSCNVVRWRDTNHTEGNNSCNCIGDTVTNTLSENSTAKQPEQYDTVVEESRSYTNVSPVDDYHFSSYSISSSITQNINPNQNIAEPQVNNVATSDRVILPSSRDPRRSKP